MKAASHGVSQKFAKISGVVTRSVPERSRLR